MGEMQVRSRLVQGGDGQEESRGAKHAGPSDGLKAFSDRWKVDQQAQRVITPDVIVNEGGPGAEKSSVEGKEAAVARG